MPLDQETTEFLSTLTADPPPSWEDLGPTQGREVFASLKSLYSQGPKIPRVEDRQTDNGVRLRYYYPTIESPLPAVVYLHGGGWVLGDLDTHDALCRRLAAESDAVVVSVDYQRAPEARFPQPLQDCQEALNWVVSHSEDINIDATKLAIAGDSSGGHLAACLGLSTEIPLCHALLLYPVIEPNFETRSYQEFVEGYALTRSDMRWFWQQLLGDSQPREAIPTQSPNLDRFPPCTLFTAEYDVLRDEAEGFFSQLQAAGVPVHHRR